MKKLTLKMALVALMCAGFTTNVSAADCPEFGAAVYERWPNADDYCLEVVERDGKEYARFEAEVVSQSPSGTYVRYTKPDGSKGPSRKVNPPPGFEAMISGKGVEIADMNPRQKMNVYLPELAWAPEPVAAAAPPPPPPAPAPEPEPEPAPVMPTTAGSMGWLVMFGAMFLLLGGALRFARQR